MQELSELLVNPEKPDYLKDIDIDEHINELESMVDNQIQKY